MAYRYRRLFIVLWLGLLFTLPIQNSGALELPDFRAIVKSNSNAVVNINTTQSSKTAEGKPDPRDFMPDLPEDSPFYEWFRKFFENQPDLPESHEMASLGSGFIISPDGYILTNTHIMKNADQINVKLSNYSEKQAKLIGLDERTDVALLKIEGNGYTSVKLGDSDKLEVGEWVLAIGSPFGLELTATQGIVSAVGRSLPSDSYVPFIQTDVAVNPGNSGGPLFNTNGEVVGINAQIYSQTGGYMGLSFAIPINVALQVSEQLKSKGFALHGWLGVVIQPVTQDLARSFGLETPKGALVAQVMDNSPAQKAGFKIGDIITEYNHQPILQSSDLPPLVGATQIGKTVQVKIIRNAKPKTLDVIIEKLAEPEQTARAVTKTEELTLLNITVEDISESDRKKLDLKQGGVVVTGVKPGPAANAGIRPGDIILMLNNEEVANSADFAKLVKKLPKGKPTAVLVQRGDSPLFLSLTIPDKN